MTIRNARRCANAILHAMKNSNSKRFHVEWAGIGGEHLLGPKFLPDALSEARTSNFYLDGWN